MAYSRRASRHEGAYSNTKRELFVYIGGRLAGTLFEHDDRVRSFRYTDSYAGPRLSLSMPKRHEVLYADELITPWIEGLLPDNILVRADMASKAGCGVDDLCSILERYGLDCPGAVQIVSEKTAGLLGISGTTYRPISDAAIAERLVDAQSKSQPVWVGETERWSLGGAQGKIALAKTPYGWAICEGAAASTHILKPGVSGFNSEALDEYASMRLARLCGLDVANVEFEMFAGVPAIVVERYDRSISESGAIIRLHQEDLCQALGYLPADKYLPTPLSIIDVLSADSTMGSTRRFVEALLFNYLIGATDAHAKNYSLILYSDDTFELAPLYDIASILPYKPKDFRKRHAAMSIGRNNIFGEMCGSNLDRFSDNCGIDRSVTRDWYARIATRILDTIGSVADELSRMSAQGGFPESFERTITANCEAALANLDRNGKTIDLSFVNAIHSGTVPRESVDCETARRLYGIDDAKKARKRSSKGEKAKDPKQSM